MLRSIASALVLTAALAGCNAHPLYGVDYDHYTGEAPDDTAGASAGDTDFEDSEGGTGGPGPDAGDSDGGTGGSTGGSTGATTFADTDGGHYCGDGEVDDDEECDDADMNGEPGFCSAECTEPGPT